MLTGLAKAQIEVDGLILPGDPDYMFKDPGIEELARLADELGAQMALTYLNATYATNMVNVVAANGLFMSIHSASPGTSGANELAAGTAYTAVSGGRPPITWSETSGVATSTDTQTYAMLVTQSGGIPYFGLWSANTGGSYIFGGPTSGLSGSVPSGANVTFTSSVTLTQSG